MQNLSNIINILELMLQSASNVNEPHSLFRGWVLKYVDSILADPQNTFIMHKNEFRQYINLFTKNNTDL